MFRRMFRRAKNFTVDGAVVTTKERTLNGCQIEALTPWPDGHDRLLLLERPGEPDLLVTWDTEVPIRGGEQFSTVPRGTWGG